MVQDLRPLVVVTNREPYEDVLTATGWQTIQRAGGVTAALDPVMQATGGEWIAWGSGSADRLAAPDGVRRVPPTRPRYRLHRVDLSAREVAGYYAGYANQGLWPLSHLLVERARFRQADWEQYRRVNRRFAETVAERAPVGARVFTHDYHLTLVPELVRRLRPDVALAHFWHIPWAPWRVFRLCPQRDIILRGLLGADVLGFQTPADREAFVTAAEQAVGAVADGEGWVRWEGRRIRVGVFPVTVDARAIAAEVSDPRLAAWIRGVRRRLAPGGRRLVVSVDRADYTKGILARLAGVEAFFAHHPEHRGQVTFVQVVVPTRLDVPEYRELFDRILAESDRINARFASGRWQPLVTVRRAVDRRRVLGLLAAADIGLVTSLYDGMNLVAKEFVASHVDEDGVLLVSQSAGAADELDEALRVNPLDPDGMALAIGAALAMPAAERRRRMRRMRAYLMRYGSIEWLHAILEALDEAVLARDALGVPAR
ncbi:MAG: trehalose-6-phosphate synthase [Actinomycetia bacterium]|nr:trehalose-6-phosphate synthase [Actinomycetes bacterium]